MKTPSLQAGQRRPASSKGPLSCRNCTWHNGRLAFSNRPLFAHRTPDTDAGNRSRRSARVSDRGGMRTSCFRAGQSNTDCHRPTLRQRYYSFHMRTEYIAPSSLSSFSDLLFNHGPPHIALRQPFPEEASSSNYSRVSTH